MIQPDAEPLVRLRAQQHVESFLNAIEQDVGPSLLDLLAAEQPESEIVHELVTALVQRGAQSRRRLGLPVRYKLRSNPSTGGGFGTVHEAIDQTTGDIVALKLGRSPMGPVQRQRYWREATIARKIQHPGVCKVLEYDVEGDPPYVAMCFERGVTLEAWATTRPRPLSQAATNELLVLVAEVAEATQVLHDHEIIHRDIKPNNVIRRDMDGSAVLVDLGLARAVDDDQNWTAPWQVPGTPGFIAPECLLSAPQDQRSDIWSIGATLFHCLSGESLLDGRRQSQLDDAKTGAYLRSLQPLAGSHPDLFVVLQRALAAHPLDRYGNAADLAADLRRVANRQPPLASPLTTRRRALRWVQRNPRATVAGIALAVMAVFSAFGWRDVNVALASARSANLEVMGTAADLMASESTLRETPGTTAFRTVLIELAARMLGQLDARGVDRFGVEVNQQTRANYAFHLAKLLVRAGRPAEARPRLEQAIQLLAGVSPNPKVLQMRVAIQSTRAGLAASEGRVRSAITQYEAALASVPGGDAAPDFLALQLAEAEHELAFLLMEIDRSDQAWEHSRSSQAWIERAATDRPSAEWWRSMVRHQELLARLMASEFRATDARQTLEAALALCERPILSQGMDADTLRARLLTTRGRIGLATDQPEAAERALERALGILEPLAEADPQDAHLRSQLIDTWIVACDLAVHRADLSLAANRAKAARRWLAKTPEHSLPKADWLAIRCAVDQRTANVLVMQERHGEARQLLSDLVTCLRTAADSPAVAGYLSSVLGQLGRAELLAGGPARAEVALMEAVEIRQNLGDRYGWTPKSRQRLASQRIRLANALGQRRRTSAALHLSTRGLSTLEELVRASPGDLSLRQNWVEALIHCARLDEQHDNPEGAEELFRLAAHASDPTRWVTPELTRLHVVCVVQTGRLAAELHEPWHAYGPSRLANHWFGELGASLRADDRIVMALHIADMAIGQGEFETAASLAVDAIRASDTRNQSIERTPRTEFEAATVRTTLARALLGARKIGRATEQIVDSVDRVKAFRDRYPENLNHLRRMAAQLQTLLSRSLPALAESKDASLCSACEQLVHTLAAAAQKLGKRVDTDEAIRDLRSRIRR